MAHCTSKKRKEKKHRCKRNKRKSDLSSAIERTEAVVLLFRGHEGFNSHSLAAKKSKILPQVKVLQ